MTPKEFRSWLEGHKACKDALQWLDTLPEPTLQAAWEVCPRGDWMLWLHEQTGTPFEVLAPAVYNATNRALRHAALALDNAGLGHKLGDVVVADTAGARAAEVVAVAAAGSAEAAKAAEAAVGAAALATARAARTARAAARTAEAAARAAARAARTAEAAARAAAGGSWPAADAATEAERLRCADDCRRLLPLPTMESEEGEAR